MTACEGGSCGTPDYQLLTRARDGAEAGALAARLEAAGIAVIQVDASSGGGGAAAEPGPGACAHGFDLYVSADVFGDALDVLSRPA